MCTKFTYSVSLFLSLDVCNVPVVVYYDASNINYQVTINNSTTSASLGSGGAIDMSYDPISRRLFYYESNKFYSIEQDGSDLKQIVNALNVERFTIDGRNNVIYYILEQNDKVHMINMTSLENEQVTALANIDGVKDVDMDSINQYVL